MVAKRRHKLVAARKAAGYTQEGLAEALPVDRSTVQRWEAGEHAPWPYLWPKLARLLGLRSEQLQALFVDDDPHSPASNSRLDQAVALEDMKRRTLMKWSVAAAAATSLSAGGATSVGMNDVKRLQRAAARLHSLDQQHGGDSLWQAALVQAHNGVQLLEHGTYTDSVGNQLLVATGQLQICAGWLAFDAGQQAVAHGCFTDALALSRQAADAQTETRALANLAMQSNALARPREALRYAAGAAQAARGPGAAPWLSVLPQLRLAIGRSLSGDARETDRAIAQARRILEQDNTAPEEEWSAFLSPLEVDAIEATCALDLHRPARAERLLEQAIAGYTKQCARNVALYRVWLAQARLAAGCVDGAAEAAHAALDDLKGEVESQRVSKELADVAQRLAAYPEVDGVHHFVSRYQALN